MASEATIRVDVNVTRNGAYHAILVSPEGDKPGIAIAYDGIRDVVSIEHQEYAADLFRAWGANGLRAGTWFRLERSSAGSPVICLAADEPGWFTRAWRWAFGRRGTRRQTQLPGSSNQVQKWGRPK